MSKFKILIFFLLFSSAFVFKALAQAPSNYDVTVSPVFFDLSTKPGGIVSDKIRIRNNTNSPLPIKLSVKKLTGDVNGDLTLRDVPTDESISWIKFTNENIVAKPLEWTDVPFKIEVPTSASYGYYFAVTFAHDSNSPLGKTGTAITGAAAVPILLNVKKEGAKAEAKVVEFKTNANVIEYLPVDFTVKVKNSGNVHVRPHGNIFITDSRGKDVGILEVNQGLGNIIPDTQRSFLASWEDGFIVREKVLEDGQPKLDKDGKPIEKTTINWNKLTSFRIGKYTANLLLVFDNGTRDVTLESTTSFWVIPYKAIGVIVITIIALFFILRFLLRLYIRKQIKKGLSQRS